MKNKYFLLVLVAISGTFFFLNFTGKGVDTAIEWREYLGGPGRMHYSPLKEITPDNVKNLQVAWQYHTGDSSGQMQSNPIIVDGVLYAPTASVEIFALDAATGKELWRFSGAPKSNTSRGVTYWEEGEDKRILFTAGPWLYALNAKTGKIIDSFGDSGRVSLRLGLPDIAKNKSVVSNTPGTIYKNLIVMPVRVSEGPDAAPGHVRAFNVRTGQLAWTFRTIPNPDEEGYETWGKENWKNTDVGAANNWAGMAIDRERGIIYVPTGSAGYDFYGGNRPGDNLFANCLLALNAATGKKKWHFQFVHHDLWDRDLPSPPTLVQVVRNGKKIDAVVQITKSGFVYMFDRVTGKSLFPIKEIPVPTNGLPGEKPARTQPVPMWPEPFSRQSIGDTDINPYSANKGELLARLKGLRHQNQFELPSEEGTLIFPGFDGGGEWGGPAYDPKTSLLYINSNEMAWIMNMLPVPKGNEYSGLSPGNQLYQANCGACHGQDLGGSPASGYPSLKLIKSSKNQEFVHDIVKRGKGMMPGFPALKTEDRQILVDFLFGIEKEQVADSKTAKVFPLPYRMNGYKKFLDKDGYPAIAPPWGPA